MAAQLSFRSGRLWSWSSPASPPSAVARTWGGICPAAKSKDFGSLTQIFVKWKSEKNPYLILSCEWLRHLSEPLFRDLDGLLRRKVAHPVAEVLLVMNFNGYMLIIKSNILILQNVQKELNHIVYCVQSMHSPVSTLAASLSCPTWGAIQDI